MLYLFAASVLLTLLLLCALGRLSLSNRHHLLPPPGPPTKFLSGSNIPPLSSVTEYEQLIEKYGPVISFKRGSQRIVVVGRKDAAIEIMERSGVRLADRPALVATDAVSGGMRLLFMSYGERFRKYRRALHTHLNTAAIPNYAPFITRDSRNLVRDILRDPDNHQLHMKTMSCSTILSITYGKSETTSLNDPEAKAIHKVLARVGQVVRPGSHLVELFPLLRFIPAYMKKFGVWHQEELALFRSQIQTVREAIAMDKAHPSFAREILNKQTILGLSDDEIAYLAGAMFGAGSDSTAAALSIVVLAAATHPEEQNIVYDELTQVVGSSTVPTFEILRELPKLAAFVIESYRWRPVSGGTPHRASADIMWKNYCIPKDSIVIGNHWSITRDPEHFRDPEVFRPSRWLDSEGNLTEEPEFFNFGFGRRLCPGQHLARSTVLLNAALLMWSFDISEDKKRSIDVNAFYGSLVVAPAPFTPHFTPRSRELESFLGLV